MKLEAFPFEIRTLDQDPASQVEQKETAGLIHNLLRNQDAFARAVIAARFGFEGPPLKIRAIATKFRCSKSTVGRALKSALESLRRELAAQEIRNAA